MTVYQATDGSVSVGVQLWQQEECCEAKGIVHTFLLSLAVVVEVLVMLYDVNATKIMLSCATGVARIISAGNCSGYQGLNFHKFP